MAQPERISKRKISSFNDGDPHFGISSPDLSELNLEPGDEVLVTTFDNRIVIEPLDESDNE